MSSRDTSLHPTEKGDVTLDAGPAGCGDLLMLVFQTMKTLPPGAVLEVLAYDPAAALDLAAWCRMTGHVLRSQNLTTLPHRFCIQKRAAS